MKKISLKQQQTNRTIYRSLVLLTTCLRRSVYLVCVVEIQDPAPFFVHLLVALVRAAHAEGRIHVDVVTSQIQ